MNQLKTDALARSPRGRKRKANAHGNTHVALKVDQFNALNAIGADLQQRLGVKLSAHEVVLFLMNHWEKTKPCAK